MIDQEKLTIKRIATSRSLRLRLTPKGQIIVTTPRFVSDRQVRRFIEENEAWIEEKQLQLESAHQDLTASKDRLLFRGHEYLLRLTVASTKSGVKLENNQILVTSSSEDHNEVRAILEKWYRAQAKQRFTERVPLLADLMGHDIMTVSIRDQRSRWGSCSSRSNISLNWRLIQAPDSVSDYVIYHELTHLKHMNHSRDFWNSLAELVPDYKSAEKWLKDNHKLLNF